MKIVVLDGYTLNPGDNPWDPVASLGELVVYDRTSDDQVLERASNADIVLTNKVQLTKSTLDQLPQLKFVSVLATGFNQIDLDATRSRSIAVSNVPEYSTRSVAQHVFAMLLSRIHRPQQHHDAIQQGRWAELKEFSFTLSPLLELAGKTMGIYGYGRIGESVGRLANAFGMDVLAYRRNPVPEDTAVRWVSASELIAESDYLSLHCPQTEETTGMVNEAFLGKMKRSAVLINTARGGLVNEAELAEALSNGVISGACLDVVSQEPIDQDNPLLNAPNCLLTPHVAWNTVEARRRLMKTTAENIEAFIDGGPINVVN